MIDFFETPPALAEEMVSYAREDVRVIADLAAGSGALLKAARRRWHLGPTYLACDSDPAFVSGDLADLHWLETYQMDSLSLEPRETADIVRRRLPDLILLNPPFSYRGGRFLPVELDGHSYRVSPAMAFLARSIELLDSGGQVVALLPRNSVMGQRDESFRDLLYERHGLECLQFLAPSDFPGVNSSTVIVRLCRDSGSGRRLTLLAPRPAGTVGIATLELLRGRLSPTVARESSGSEGVRYIHSTDLRRLDEAQNSYVVSRSAVHGLLVLLPRVGYPTPDNIRTLRSDAGIVLSDCVLALRVPDEGNLESLSQYLLANLASLRARYHGSCAPYITVRGLSEWLKEGGWLVQIPGRH